MAAYAELIRRVREAALLDSCRSLLAWDQETYMPAGGVEHRANQLALLAGLVHARRTDAALWDLLLAAETDQPADPTSDEAVNLRELRRQLGRARKLPATLVEELARTCSHAQQVWAEARKEDRFADFAPWLEKVVHLKRQEAEAVGFDDHPYDALLDEYEPGARRAALADLFVALRQELLPLVASIAGAANRPDASLVRREYSVERQEQIGRAAAADFGFDFSKGRLDPTNHPFCMGIGPGDVRLTTRYKPNYFNDGFFSTLHEAGHGIYEQGLDRAHYGTPRGEAASLGVHESQSRLWENAVGRSRAFWRHCWPTMQAAFPAATADVSPEQFHFAVNAVAPSLIRVDADEATYNLHIIVRFELEQSLLTGDLSIADLPGAWREKYRAYLGIEPATDRDGCLQDIHWSAGLVGYFPTYTLGNIYAAELIAAAGRHLGDLDEYFERGDFRPLLDWLRENVHCHGQRYRPADLVARAIGCPPQPAALVAGLRANLQPLYLI